MITAALSALIVSGLALMGMTPGPAAVVGIVVVVKLMVVGVLGILGLGWVKRRGARQEPDA